MEIPMSDFTDAEIVLRGTSRGVKESRGIEAPRKPAAAG
jgi:hypothetical protein